MRKSVLCILLAAVLGLFCCVSPAFAINEGYGRLMDEAGLLTAEEKSELSRTLDEISERQGMDVVIVTVYSLYGQSAMRFADDYFDYNGYGQGADRSGVLLLHSPGDREWWITTRGYGITAFTDAGLDYIGEQIKGYLADGDNAAAYGRFAELCDEFITQAKNGSPYDYGTLPRDPLPLWTIPLAVAIGLIAAFLIVGAMKAKLKTVRFKAEANSYIRKGSFAVTQSRDTFLYRHVMRTPRPRNTGGGGSRTHVGSSGARHGGRGGRY